MNQSMSFPILNQQFFQDHPVPVELYRAWEDAFRWSEKILPVYQWKNLLYIAVSEAPAQWPQIDGMEAKIVLTTAEALKQCWAQFQNQVYKPVSAYNHPDTTLQAPEFSHQAPEFLLQDSHSAISLSDNSGVADIEQLEGLDKISLPVSKNNENAPDGFSIDSYQPSSAPSAATDHELLMDLQPEVGHNLSSSLTPDKIKSPANVSTDEVPADIDEKTDPNIKDLPAEYAETEFFQKIFEQLSYHFTKSMVLIVDDPRSVGVRPWKWDSQFHVNTGSPQSYPLDVASPFRIVYRTQKPYHGYLVSNDINDRFFENWNDNVTPDHMTLYPVTVNDSHGDDVKAMILCIGEKSADNKNSLSLTGKMALEVALFLENHPEVLAEGLKTASSTTKTTPTTKPTAA